jgi:ABC-type multidrug transport system fused ATPase/permease subunit
MKEKNGLKIVWFFLSKYRFSFMFLIGLAVFLGILETLNVALIAPILSNSFGSETANNVFINFINIFINFIPIDDILIKYCILFVIFAFLAFFVKLVFFFISAELNAMIVTNIKQEIFEKCINSDYQFFIDHKQGEILYKIFAAPAKLVNILTIISDSFVEIILSVSIFILLFSMSWIGTLLILICGIGYYYLAKYLGVKISYKAGKKKRESGQRQTVIISEFTSGIKQIKVFETYPYWKNLFNKTLYTYWKHQKRGYFWSRVPETLILLLAYVLIAGTIVFVKLQNPSSFTSAIPVIGTFAFAIMIILPKLSKFGSYRMEFMDLFPDIESIFEMLKDTAYNKIKNGEKEFSGLNSGIELRNVTFAYKNRNTLLNDVSLLINKDKITALVGPSGSGKSTIVNLLLRLHDVDSGGVYIDDTNIKDYNIFSFLKKVGFVSQDTFIFNASVRDNIAFGNVYTDQEVIEAAELANADGFIQKLPEKYDTVVGDRGMKLSGGEKQRIAIARAMIRKPEILVLDEATSSLDNLSESIVQKAINNVSKNCTTFIIAHRLSTIQNADTIYVMDQGKIVESGIHADLLNKKGKYWELYNIQKS